MGAVLTANALPELPAFVSGAGGVGVVVSCALPTCACAAPVCVCSRSLPEHAAFTPNSGTPAQYFFGHILSAMGMYTLLFTATATLGLRIWAYSVGDWPLCNRVQRPSNAPLPLRVVDVAGGQKLGVLGRLFTRHPCEW